MNKRVVWQTPEDSAERVLAHAAYQRFRGKNLAMSFCGEKNPQKALRMAGVVSRRNEALNFMHQLGEITRVLHLQFSWEEMSDDELQAHVSMIIITSDSEEMIRQRVRDELGYPHAISLLFQVPNNEVGRQARELFKGLGGLVTKNGAMVTGTIDGHEELILL